MNLKIGIVSITLATLLTAVYSSSTFIVFAELNTACVSTGKKTTFCEVDDSEDGKTIWNCTKNKDGKTWSCVQALNTGGSTNIPSALKDALVKAHAGITTGGNETISSGLKDKISKGQNLLKGGETLKDDQSSEPDDSANGNATIQ